MTYDYVLLPWPALCIFCLYMFAQSTDLFDQLPSWLPVGRDSLGSVQDTAWFPHVHGLQRSSFSIPSSCTWSCRLIAWTMASMVPLPNILATVEWNGLCISWYISNLLMMSLVCYHLSKCRSLWLDLISWCMVGHEMWPGVFCLSQVTWAAWTCCCNGGYEIALSVVLVIWIE
jgi:hypothetical protein